MANLLIPPILPFGRMTDRLGGVQPAGRQDSFGDRCVSSRWYNHDLTVLGLRNLDLTHLDSATFDVDTGQSPPLHGLALTSASEVAWCLC